MVVAGLLLWWFGVGGKAMFIFKCISYGYAGLQVVATGAKWALSGYEKRIHELEVYGRQVMDKKAKIDQLFYDIDHGYFRSPDNDLLFINKIYSSEELIMVRATLSGMKYLYLSEHEIVLDSISSIYKNSYYSFYQWLFNFSSFNSLLLYTPDFVLSFLKAGGSIFQSPNTIFIRDPAFVNEMLPNGLNRLSIFSFTYSPFSVDSVLIKGDRVPLAGDPFRAFRATHPITPLLTQ